MTSKGTEFGWGFLAFLTAAASWLCLTGWSWVVGFSAHQVEMFAAQRGILGPKAVPPGLHLGQLSGDIFWCNGALLVAASLLALLAGLFFFRKLWQNPLSPVLTMGSLFFGSGTLWVQTHTAHDGLVHLLETLALVAFMSGKVALMSGMIPLLCLLKPAAGVALYIPLAFLALRRHSAYGPVVTAAAVVGVGALLVPMVGRYTLEPSLAGWTWWTLLPLFLALWPQEIRGQRWGFYLTLLLGSALTGRPELASAVALGDLALVLLKRTESAPEASDFPEASWSVSGRTLLQVGALVVFILQVLPGEQYLNRHILIPAQRKKVPFAKLFAPFHLAQHATSLESEPWRKTTPFPQLRTTDIELLDQLPEGPFCVLTEGRGAEDRTLSLLYAILAQRELTGWDGPDHLSGPFLLCKERGRNFLLNGPSIVMRSEGKAELAQGPTELPAEPPKVDFRLLLEAPYLNQPVSKKPGSGYLWVSEGRRYTVVFPDQPAEVVLGPRPGKVKLLSLVDQDNTRELEIHPTNWLLRYVPSQEVLPSRSLVSLPMVLENKGAGAITSESLAAITLTTDKPSFSPFQQPLQDRFILFPGESIDLDLVLATPESEGTYALRAMALTPQGLEHPLPINGEPKVKTWRRLPPVGTWVEEP